MKKAFKLILLILIATIVSSTLHASYVLKSFDTNSDRVSVLISGPRTDIGDNYYYYSILKNFHDIYSAPIVRKNDSDLADHRITNGISKTFATSLFAGELIYKIAGLLTKSSNEYALITSILLTAVLYISIFQFLSAFSSLDNQDFYVLSFYSIVGILFVDYVGLSTFTNNYSWIDHLFTYRSNTTRIINPNVFWAIGLLASLCIGLWLSKNNNKYYLSGVALTILTGLNSIALSLPLLAAIFIVFLVSIIKKNGRSLMVFGLLVAITIPLLYNYYLFYTYSITDLGSQLKHGNFLGLHFKMNFFYFLPIALGIYFLGAKHTKLFLITVFITSLIVGVISESIDLGSRLWIRGVVIFGWLIFLIACIQLSLMIKKRYSPFSVWFKAISFACIITLFFLTIHEQKINPASWSGYLPKDKWNAMRWMNINVPKNSIIAVGNIEDAYLLPIYTSTKPIYTMYSITNRTINQESVRFWYNMRLFDQDQALFDELISIKQSDIDSYMEIVSSNPTAPLIGIKFDAIIYLKLILYYPHSKEYSNIYKNSEEFKKFINEVSFAREKALHSHFDVDYALIQNNHKLPKSFHGWPTLYSNPSYSIVKKPN